MILTREVAGEPGCRRGTPCGDVACAREWVNERTIRIAAKGSSVGKICHLRGNHLNEDAVFADYRKAVNAAEYSAATDARRRRFGKCPLRIKECALRGIVPGEASHARS